MAKKKFEFAAKEASVEIDGHEFTFRALTVRELEGLVKAHEGDEEEEALTAAIIVTGETSGLLEGYTADDFGSWPVMHYRKIQAVVTELNGLGESAEGN